MRGGNVVSADPTIKSVLKIVTGVSIGERSANTPTEHSPSLTVVCPLAGMACPGIPQVVCEQFENRGQKTIVFPVRPSQERPLCVTH